MWNGKTSIYKVQAILLVKGPGVETADVSRRMGILGRMIKMSDGTPGWAYFTSDGVDGLQPLDLHLTYLFELIKKKGRLPAAARPFFG